MSPCSHESMEYVGEQKTDDGVNTYFRCARCKGLIVATPSRKLYGIPAS